MVAKTLMFRHVFVRMPCLTDDLSSDTLSTPCTHSRNDFGKASACVDEMLLLLLLAWHALVKSSEGLAHVDVDDSTGSPLEPVPTYYGGPAHGPVENAARKRVERQMSTLHPSIICSHSELQRQTSLRFSPLQRTTSPFMMLSQRRACRLSPPVPTRILTIG